MGSFYPRRGHFLSRPTSSLEISPHPTRSQNPYDNITLRRSQSTSTTSSDNARTPNTWPQTPDAQLFTASMLVTPGAPTRIQHHPQQHRTLPRLLRQPHFATSGYRVDAFRGVDAPETLAPFMAPTTSPSVYPTEQIPNHSTPRNRITSTPTPHRRRMRPTPIHTSHLHRIRPAPDTPLPKHFSLRVFNTADWDGDMTVEKSCRKRKKKRSRKEKRSRKRSCRANCNHEGRQAEPGRTSEASGNNLNRRLTRRRSENIRKEWERQMELRDRAKKREANGLAEREAKRREMKRMWWSLIVDMR